MSTPSASARAAVLDALRLLAAQDDLGADEGFVRAVSLRRELTPGQSTACRKLLARHVEHLPTDLLAAAMSDEPDSAPASRRRGRPRLGDDVLTPAERSRRRRSGGDLAVLEVPAALAARFREVRDARACSSAELLAAALDALAAAR